MEKNIDVLVRDILKLFDQYVWLNNWVWFEQSFAEIGKKHGFDSHQIYYGEPYEEMKKRHERYKQVNEFEKREVDAFAASETDVLFYRYCSLKDEEREELDKKIGEFKSKTER